MKAVGLLSALILTVPILTSVPIFAEEHQTMQGDRIASIDAKVSSIKVFEKKNPSKLKVFEATESESGTKLTELPEMPGTVPEGSLFMVYVLHGDDNSVLMYEVDPTSESGDWSASFTHYYDDHGRTIMFEFYSGSFNSGCTDVLRIRKKYYYDEEFNLIKNVVTHTDKDEKPINNFERCDTYGIQRAEPRIYSTYQETESQTHKSREPYIKETPMKTSENTLGIYKPNSAQEYLVQQRLQWEKENAEIDRLNQRRTKIRLVLYVISATAILMALILLIRKKVKSKNVDKN